MNSAQLKIDSDFPGGNILVEEIDGDRITLRPDLRDTQGHWFYWNFEVIGAAGRKLNFHFNGGKCIGARGPAISRDGGGNWTWLNHSELPEREAFSYQFGQDEDAVRFAFCLPYTVSHWKQFEAMLPAGASISTLCDTRQDRPVPLVSFPGDSADAPTVVLTARHHACETPGSFVLEGFLQEWAQLEKRPATLLALPLMDLDGVENGDQGKNRRPHDHNRDYTETPIYSETRVLMQKIQGLQTPLVVLDLHAPYLREGDAETVYLVGSANHEMATEQDNFSALLAERAHGLPYHSINNVPFGQKWNTAGNFKTGRSFSAWAESLPNCLFSVTVEIPYANAEGVEVNVDTLHQFGASLAQTTAAYLQTKRLQSIQNL